MPNHFHAIIMIGENMFNAHGRDVMHRVSTNKFGPQSKNLGSIIRGFKSSVTMAAKKLSIEWQERYHDHIIRNQNELIRISDYIINNPRNWKADKFSINDMPLLPKYIDYNDTSYATKNIA